MDMAAIEYLSYDQIVEKIKNEVQCADKEIIQSKIINENLEKKNIYNTDSKIFDKKYKTNCNSICNSLPSSSGDNYSESLIESKKTLVKKTKSFDYIDNILNQCSNNKSSKMPLEKTQDNVTNNLFNNYLNKSQMKNNTTNPNITSEKFNENKTNKPYIQSNILQKYNLKTERFKNQKLTKTKLSDTDKIFTSYVIDPNIDNIEQQSSFSSSSFSETEKSDILETLSQQSYCNNKKLINSMDSINYTRNFHMNNLNTKFDKINTYIDTPYLTYNSKLKISTNNQKFNNTKNLFIFNKKLKENYEYYKKIAEMKQKSMLKAATKNLIQNNSLTSSKFVDRIKDSGVEDENYEESDDDENVNQISA